MLDVRRLKILRAIARTGSLAAAGRELSYSTPAVWQQMQRLEDEAGAALIERHPRGVRLTPAGEALVTHADALLERLALAEADVRRLDGGELRVAAFATAAALLGPAVARLAGDRPEIRLVLDEAEPDAALVKLRTGAADVAVVYDAPAEGPDAVAARHVLGQTAAGGGVALRHLLDEPLVAIAPAGHALAQAAEVTPEWLADKRVLRGRHGPVAGPAGAVDYRGDDFATVVRLVGAGAGVAVVPRLALEPGWPGLVVRPLAPAAGRRRIWVALPGDRPPTAAAERCAGLLAAVAETLARSWRTVWAVR